MYSSALLRSTVVGLVLCAQGLAAPFIINREAQGSEPDPNVLKEPICTTYNKGFIDFVVNMHGWGTNEKGCGEGLLDNMHGENGLVLYWTCDGKGGNLTQAKFSLPPTIDTATTKSPGRIVNEAIQKASFGVLDPNVDFCS